jgi:hypothetical protein
MNKGRKLTTKGLADHVASDHGNSWKPFDEASSVSGRSTLSVTSSSSRMPATSAKHERDLAVFQEIKDVMLDIIVRHFNYDGIHRVLYHAAFMGEKEVVKIIITFCPDAINRPNEKRNKSTPLMAACLNTQKHFEVVQMLLDHGADTTLKSNHNAYGNTAFHWAAVRGAESALRCLLEKNPNGRNIPDLNKQTPLEVLDTTPDSCFDKDIEDGSIPNVVLLDSGDKWVRKERIRHLLLDCLPSPRSLHGDFTLSTVSTDSSTADAPDAAAKTVADSMEGLVSLSMVAFILIRLIFYPFIGIGWLICAALSDLSRAQLELQESTLKEMME